MRGGDMLVNGQWSQSWNPFQKTNTQGDFLRQRSTFRHWITVDGQAGPTGDAGFKAEPGRYHLYVALICPWASRTLIVRALKGLNDIIGVTVLDPRLSEQGWHFAIKNQHFTGAESDPLYDSRYLHELYTQAAHDFTGRVTVPVLWDKQQKTIVNNESADIIQMLNSAFTPWANNSLNLRPVEHLTAIESDNLWLYENFNNAVYQAGFAQSQQAYEIAVNKVFSALEAMQHRLSDGRKYWHGEQFTETDIRAFVTLIRFDAAYYNLFKCNIKQLKDYPAVQQYMERIYRLDNVAKTVDIVHIKHGYYSVKALNPQGITPVGPNLSWL